jgi:FkbM family methyltransferase
VLRKIELKVNQIARYFGIEIRRRKSIEKQEMELRKYTLQSFALEMISNVKIKNQVSTIETLEAIRNSQSQLGQDFFALTVNGMKKNGYFVEFGAADGIHHSNTFLLEKNYLWTGILAEPSKSFISSLRRNRKCKVVDKCVWSKSGEELLFTEAGELSTLESFKNLDFHAKSRSGGVEYEVTTVSLLDLLDSNDAPQIIDFLSIDTEGSEYEILNNFDFSKYTFNAICVEHNFTEERNKIFNLLIGKGYKKVFEEHSRWDDWYVKA